MVVSVMTVELVLQVASAEATVAAAVTAAVVVGGQTSAADVAVEAEAGLMHVSYSHHAANKSKNPWHPFAAEGTSITINTLT